MFFRKNNTLINSVLLFVVLSFILPITSLAFNSDDIYVWSNNSSFISTSILPSSEDLSENSNSR